MERTTLGPMGMGEQSLTPGEQRILALMEQGQQRMEQQFKDLTLKVDQEAAASKTRDRELAAELQRVRQEDQERSIRFFKQFEHSLGAVQEKLLTTLYAETNSLRAGLFERLDQHDTRLRVVEQTLERHDEHLREHGEAIQGLQQEMRKLTAAVEHLTQAPRVAASP